MSAPRTAEPRTERRRSTRDEATHYTKLTLREDGKLERVAYAESARDVTSSLARRAALFVAAAREVA